MSLREQTLVSVEKPTMVAKSNRFLTGDEMFTINWGSPETFSKHGVYRQEGH